MKSKTQTRGSRRSPEQSQRAILEAAAREFATEGVAGARTDSIAQAAGVNKALLYYYFHDKEGLYGAVLHHVVGNLLQELMDVLNSGRPASYRVLAYAATHFNYIASHPEYGRLMQFEMMRAGAGKSSHFPKLVQQFFRPLMMRVIEVLREGIRSGEFRAVHPENFLQSMLSTIVFYFVALPAIRIMMPVDPLSRTALKQRRDAVLDMVSGSLFNDRSCAPRIIAEVNRNVAPVPSNAAALRKKGMKL
jgi:TetR/AcrR family transcriptional regulator